MSDPVSNVDIEDVLTSIRRLVSGGDWGQVPENKEKSDKILVREDPKAESGNTAPDSPKAESKFVLTPALRVVEASPDFVESAKVEDPQSPDDVSSVTAQSAETSTTATIEEASHEPARTDEFQAWQDGTENQDHGGEVSTEGVAFEAEADYSDDEESVSIEPEGEEHTAAASIEDVIAGLEAAVDADAQEWEDVVEESDDYDDNDADVTFHHTDFSYASSLEDEAGDQAFSADLDEDLAAYMEDENVLDEETLRKLVAEVIREELQGALGERITRNVRKLVRREIYRILASEDFN